MPKNRYLTSTVIAGLFVTSMTFSPAMGQEQSLQPQGSWAITKVDRSSQGGNSYCTLSRKYDQDIVLSLGRNETEEYSLAIDFQKPTFEKDKSIKVNLQPGPGQIRAYDMMPTSEKAVVIRLGWDTGFFDVLNQSQQMKVTISNKNYSFMMPEVSKGQDDLRECMEGLQAASRKAKGGEVAQSNDVLDAEAVKPSGEFQAGRVNEKPSSIRTANVEEQEKAVLKNFADSMSDQEDGAASRKNFAKAEAKDTPVKKTAAIAPAAPKEEIVKRPASSGLTASDMAATMNNVVPAAGAANVSAAASDKDKEIKALQQKLAGADGEIQALRQQTAQDAAKTANDVKAVQGQVAALQAQNQTLQQQVSSEVAKAGEQTKAMQQQIASLTAENATLKQTADASAQKAGELKAAQDKLAAMTAENAALKRTSSVATQKEGEVAALRTSMERLQAENATLIKQQQEANAAPAAQTAEVKTLQDKIAALTTENEALKKAPATTAAAGTAGISADAQKQIDELKAKLAAVEQQKAPQVRSSEVINLTEEVKQLKAKNEQLEDTVRQTQVRIGEAAINTESKSLRTITDLETKLAAAQKDNETLAREMESLKQKQEDGSLTLAAGNWDLEQATKRYNESQREIRRLGQQLETEKMSCNREKADIEQMLFDPAIADQKQIDKISSLQDELDAARAKLAQAGISSADIASIAPAAGGSTTMTRLPDDDRNVVALRTQVRDLEAKLEMAEMRQAAVPVPSVEVEGNANAAFAKQMAQLQENVNLLRNQNDALRMERDNLHAQLDDAQGNGATRADRVASMELEMKNMERQLAMAENQNVTYQNQLAGAQRQSKGAQANVAAEQEIQKLRSRLEESERQNRVMAAASTERSERAVSSAKRAEAPAPSDEIAMNVAAIAPSAGGAAKAGGMSVQNILQRAGVSGGVQKSSAGLPGAENFAWKDNGVNGLASVKKSSNFDKQVDEYIAYQKGKCGGDFASMPSPSNSGAIKRIALYEVACVSGGAGSSSSIVFYEDGGKFIAIANQTGAADMDVAMDSRDKIADVVKGM